MNDRDGGRNSRQGGQRRGRPGAAQRREPGVDRADRTRVDRHETRDRRPHRSAKPSPRTAAFDVLLSVEEADSYANLILPGLLRDREITGRDAAFATELTYGTLRMQGRYDAILDQASTRPLVDLDPPVRVALRLGAHQLLATRVPVHAAIFETVGVARDRISSGPAQLVNAVLRRVSEKDLEEWLEELAADDSDRAIAIRYSHPEWIIRAFRQALQAPSSQDQEGGLEELLEANNVPSQVHLVLRLGVASNEDLGKVETTPGRYAATAHHLASGDPGQVIGASHGRVGVQDEGSQLVTLVTAAAPIDGPDSTWLDLCAGPGGKAALFAGLLAERGGGEFVANELHPHRTRLVKQNLRAIGQEVAIETRTGDGREIGELEPGRYDRVIVDAPCTGLGALRRRPESRWRRQPSDLPGLTALQRELLISALQAVRVGGVVGYITCSPHVAETSLVVKDALKQVLKSGVEAEVLDASEIAASVSLEELNVRGPYVQLWPHHHGTDAMFLALLRRTS